jgi:type IV pilus assembly protein PilQ
MPAANQLIRRRPSVLCAVLIVLLPQVAFAQDDAARTAPPAGAPTEITVTDRGTVRMHVADMPLATVLHLLSLEGQRNIIATANDKGRVTATLSAVTFEQALAAILVANDAGYRIAGNFVYVYTNDELAQMDAAKRPTPSTQVYYLNYISAVDAQTYLSPLVGEGGSITAPPAALTGLKSDSEEGGGHASAAQDFIIVTAPPEVHQTIRTVLKQIDVRPRQVLIEATILRANLTDENALGIDFTLVGGVDLQLLGARSDGIADVTLGTLPQDRYERFNAAAASDLTGNVPSGGLTLGIIKDKVAVFLRALEEVTDTTVLANPKVLALNKQKGQVIVGRRDGFMTTTVTETQAIQSVQFLETGTQLIFRPFIGDDGFVRVELHPEDSVGFVNAQGLPSEQTTEVTTNVILRDGETILIGGLFRELTTDARSQIPGLGNLPWLGPLFRSRSDSTNREEVIILLTIHLVDDHEAYGAASREQFENVERMRVGLRKGLMWHGRERLAHAHYSKALETMSAGDTNKALWHANMALHNNSRFVSAMRLKEKILGERAWDEDGTGGRGFLYELISQEKGYGLPLFGRPHATLKESGKPQDQPSQTIPDPSQNGEGTEGQ